MKKIVFGIVMALCFMAVPGVSNAQYNNLSKEQLLKQLHYFVTTCNTSEALKVAQALDSKGYLDGTSWIAGYYENEGEFETAEKWNKKLEELAEAKADAGDLQALLYVVNNSGDRPSKWVDKVHAAAKKKTRAEADQLAIAGAMLLYLAEEGEGGLKYLKQAAEWGDTDAMNYIADYYGDEIDEATKAEYKEKYIKAMEQKVNSGDAEAALELSRAYSEEDPEKEMQWLLKGAGMGDFDCMENLAYRYHENDDEVSSKMWFDKVNAVYLENAKHGNVAAMQQLLSYYKMIDDQKNFKLWRDKIAADYERKIKAGNPNAKRELAYFYLYGCDAPDMAVSYLSKEAKKGDLESMELLAEVYNDIDERDKSADIRKQINNELEKRAAKGDTDAMDKLYTYYNSDQYEDGAIVGKIDYEKANLWKNKLLVALNPKASGGDQAAIERLAEIYLEDFQIDEAVKWYIRSVDNAKDKSEAAYNVANAYQTGERWADALEWYRKVLNMPDADRFYEGQSCIALAKAYHLGRGVKKDTKMRESFLKRYADVIGVTLDEAREAMMYSLDMEPKG